MSDPLSAADGILTNDVVLPCQFYQRPHGPYAAERLLWLNVLEDAIRCAQNCPAEFVSGQGDQGGTLNRRRRQGLEDRTWFASDEMYYGSFRWLCDALGIEPDYLRSRIAEGVTLTRRSPVSNHHGISVQRKRQRRPRAHPKSATVRTPA